MRYKAPTILALLVFSGGLSRADELIRFKSGYEMMVLTHREEKGMIIVTLEGGGEVGFPKEALFLLEEDKPSQRTGPSPYYNRVPSRVSVGKFLAPPQEMPSRFLAQGAARSAAVTVGYSKGGLGQQRFSGGPIGEVGPGGKIGVDIRARNKPFQAGEQQESDKSRVKTMQAIVPTKEGD